MQSGELHSRKVDKKGGRALAEIAPFSNSSNLKYLEFDGNISIHKITNE